MKHIRVAAVVMWGLTEVMRMERGKCFSEGKEQKNEERGGTSTPKFQE